MRLSCVEIKQLSVASETLEEKLAAYTDEELEALSWRQKGVLAGKRPDTIRYRILKKKLSAREAMLADDVRQRSDYVKLAKEHGIKYSSLMRKLSRHPHKTVQQCIKELKDWNRRVSIVPKLD